MRFSELKTVRVKLDEPGREEFWHRVDEFGGIKTFSNAFDFPPSKIYNWKSKDSYIPIQLVKKVFGNEASQHVTAYKGEGRSKPIEKPVFPIPENNELLTRINHSVTTNKNGIPLYQATDIGLVKRFSDLLQELGEVSYTLYERDIFELRYPKYIHQIFKQMDYEENLDAKVDEEGVFKNGKIFLDNKEIDPKNLTNIYDRQKRLKLALKREDNDEITKLMKEEKEKVRKALNQA